MTWNKLHPLIEQMGESQKTATAAPGAVIPLGCNTASRQASLLYFTSAQERIWAIAILNNDLYVFNDQNNK